MNKILALAVVLFCVSLGSSHAMERADYKYVKVTYPTYEQNMKALALEAKEKANRMSLKYESKGKGGHVKGRHRR